MARSVSRECVQDTITFTSNLSSLVSSSRKKTTENVCMKAEKNTKKKLKRTMSRRILLISFYGRKENLQLTLAGMKIKVQCGGGIEEKKLKNKRK